MSIRRRGAQPDRTGRLKVMKSTEPFVNCDEIRDDSVINDVIRDSRTTECLSIDGLVVRRELRLWKALVASIAADKCREGTDRLALGRNSRVLCIMNAIPYASSWQVPCSAVSDKPQGKVEVVCMSEARALATAGQPRGLPKHERRVVKGIRASRQEHVANGVV